MATIGAPARNPLHDGRQSEAAQAIARGTQRLLAQQGFATLTELPLASGRRADIVALSASGEVWIVEVKSSLVDFLSDQKWPEYRDYCDRLWFAVAAGFPSEVLPEDAGLIVADRFGAEVLRHAPEHRLPGARRKAVTVACARTAARRLMVLADPEAALDSDG